MLYRNSKENQSTPHRYSPKDFSPKNRKFGEAVNLNKCNSPIKGPQGLKKKYNEPEYFKKQMTPSGNKEKIIRFDRQLQSRITDEMESEQYSCVSHDGSYRRRNFQMRMNNIENISNQIFGLFDYVKKTQNKGHSKLQYCEPLAQQKKDQEYYPENRSQIRLDYKKQYNYERQIQDPELMGTLKTDKIDYLFGQRQYDQDSHKNKTKFEEEVQSQRQKVNYIDTIVLSKQRIRKLEPSTLRRQINRAQQQLKQAKDSICLTPKYSKQLKSPISQIHENIDKNRKSFNLKHFQFSQKNKISEELPKEQARSYYNGRQRYQQAKFQKTNEKIFDEIQNIRNRIKSSQKRTKNMEKRYLQDKNNLTAHKKFQYDDSESMIQSKVVQNLMKDKSRIDTNLSFAPHLYKNEGDSENVSEFKINIHPVPTNRTYLQEDYVFKLPQTNRSAADSLECDKKMIVKKLIKIFKQQIEIDKRLRVIRDQFSKLIDKKKWSKLKKYLEEHRIYYTESELEKELEISISEIDPFASQKLGSGDLVKKLGDCFIEAEKFWEQKVTGVVTKRESQLSNFTIDEIDLSSKGHITIEDLVCFINLYANTHYRNRDMLTLFRRFMALSSTRQGIDMKGFMKKIVK